MTKRKVHVSLRQGGLKSALASFAVAATILGAVMVPVAANAADILRVGVSQPIDSLNPFVADSDYSNVAYEYAYPFLTMYDKSMNIVPYFAQSWDVSSDNKVWTFHTTPDAKWSDGQPLTADDAAFTYNMILKYKDGSTGKFAGWLAHLVTAEATDPNTLVLTYDKPVGNVPTQFQAVPILPPQVWSDLATGDGSKITSFQNAAPWVSGGPFIFSKYQKDQIALFSRNPNWWGTKKPSIDGFGLQFFANSDAMVSALLSDQLDMIGEQTPPTAVAALKKANMVVTNAPSTGFRNFIVNPNPDKKKNRELLDPKVRQALEYAIDRETIVKKVWLGYATVGSTIVAPATGWHDDTLKALPFDLAKANALLDEAGFKKGSDGIRMANGHPMAYDLVFPTEISGTGDRAFQIIKTDLLKVGIDLTQRKMDPDAAQQAIEGADGKYDEYDLAMWDWVPPVDPDFILGVMTCKQWGNNSDSGYCNPAYDKLYSAQSSALTAASRHDIVNQMQQIAYDSRAYIVIDYPDTLEAHNPKWTGFIPSPLVGSINNLSPETLLNVKKN